MKNQLKTLKDEQHSLRRALLQKTSSDFLFHGTDKERLRILQK